ncbi:unnamed protein product, partial [Polarella glacialis]
AVSPPDRLRDSGIEALHQDCLPLAKRFAKSLRSTAELKDVRVSLIDEVGCSSGDLGTLLYRETTDPSQDAAVFFLAGRSFAIKDSSQDFMENMRDRLVVMLNSQDAASTFRVENEGKEFTIGGSGNVESLKRFSRIFNEQTYHYSVSIVNNGQAGFVTALFRAYPFPWEVFVESEDGGDLVRIAELEEKPTVEQIRELTIQYQAESELSEAAKMVSLRDPDLDS